MTSRDFAYWLQGFFEIQNPIKIDETQLQMIKNHLNLVFKHEIDPSMGNEQHQIELNKIHSIKFPKDEDEAINVFGPKPSPKHEFSIHGWYNPEEGIPRC